MGRALPLKSFRLQLTMQLIVMSNKTPGSLSSDLGLLNGDDSVIDGEVMPEILSGNPVFEDVSELKRRIDSQALNNGSTSIVDNPNGMGTTSGCGDVNDFRSYPVPHERTQDRCEIRNESSRDAASSRATTVNQNEIDVSDTHSAEENGRNGSVSKSKASTLDTKVLDKVVNSIDSSNTYNDLPLDVGEDSKFSKVLENISLPLLYIPTTKQLVSGSHETHSDVNSSTSATVTDKEYLSISVDRLGSIHGSEQNLNSPNSLSSNTLLMPPSSSPSMHKAHSTQEFPSSLAQFPDLDHLHSVESFPSFAQHIEFGVSNFGDDSSLSNVSTGTDFSISAMSMGGEEGAGGYSDTKSLSLSQNVTDETLFMDINLHTRNSYDQNRKSASLDSKLKDQHIPLSQAAKKHPLMGFKNLFSKKSKDHESPPGWKLFGKIPPKSAPIRNAEEIMSAYQAQKEVKPHVQASRNQATEVMSTTALILENRPTNLPSKSPEEEERHRQQYEEMIEAAKKKEQKDLKQKKKHLQQRRKEEDKLMTHARFWSSDVLPSWENMHNSKKAKELWWLGLPPSVRGKVWKLAVGNDLNVTHELYEICHERAEDRIKLMQAESSLSSSASEVSLNSLSTSNSCPSNKESSVKVIKLDVSRTFPQLCIFQKGGPYYDLLHSLLGAYACYRPDVGYVQGMSFIAAIMLLNMDVADAFVCFANLLNRPCQLTFFRMDQNMMESYYRTFEEFFKENLSQLQAHFNYHSLSPNLYLMEWIFLLYSKSLPLDVACRVWDVFCRDGEEFLFRTAIGILKLYEAVLIKMDFIHMAQFLTKLPEDISADHLFRELDNVRMSIDKKGFHAVHAFFKDLAENTTLS